MPKSRFHRLSKVSLVKDLPDYPTGLADYDYVDLEAGQCGQVQAVHWHESTESYWYTVEFSKTDGKQEKLLALTEIVESNLRDFDSGANGDQSDSNSEVCDS